MSNYTKEDPEVTDLNIYDRLNYETYLLNYNVDEDAEMAKGADAIEQIRESMKGGPKFQVNDFKSVYMTIFLWFIVVLVFLIIFVVISMIIAFIIWLFRRDDLSKLTAQVCLIVLLVVLLMSFVVARMSKLKDDVQTYIEKIVYRLK